MQIESELVIVRKGHDIAVDDSNEDSEPSAKALSQIIVTKETSKQRSTLPRAEYGKGKDENGKRILSEAQRQLKYAGQQKRYYRKKSENNNATGSLMIHRNTPLAWAGHGRTQQVEFARLMKVDEEFINSTEHNVFTGFYVMMKVTIRIRYN